jgi:Kef-type K+ transport system membrane component KefB
MDTFLLELALVLVAAELGGLVSERLHLTRVAGQIAAGLVIGPSLLGLVHVDAQLQMLAGVGALCVLAVSGLETDLSAMKALGRPALLAAVGGVILPFAFGYVVMRGFGYDDRAALFVGAILTATSVGITAAALRELGLGRSATGSTILGAAVIDDILGLAVLGLVVADTGTKTGTSPLAQLVAMSAVLGVSGLAVWLLRDHVARGLHYLQEHGGGIAGLVGLVLALAWVFQAVGGLAAITGAYVAGLLVAGTHVADRMRERLVHAGEAFCIPVFLVAIGLSVDVRSQPPLIALTATLFVVAFVGKLIGSGIGARVGGLSPNASAGVGIGMVARGEVALVAATVARTSGAIDGSIYAAVVLVALGTTVVTPILLAVWARRTTTIVVGDRIPLSVPGLATPVLQTVEIE